MISLEDCPLLNCDYSFRYSRLRGKLKYCERGSLRYFVKVIGLAMGLAG